MATATLNPVITSISGSVGKMVFYTRHGKTLMRAWIMPPNPRTEAQQANRGLFRQAMAAWQQLSRGEKDALNAQARKPGITGHNLFISQYMKTHRGDDFRAETGPQEQAGRIVPACGPAYEEVSSEYEASAGAAETENIISRAPSGGQGEHPRPTSRALRRGPCPLHPACRSVTAPSLSVAAAIHGTSPAHRPQERCRQT